jgi:uncharacterized membrane protein YccC
MRVALALLVSMRSHRHSHPARWWATITVLVVIGGLQHHGNIRRRAAERGVGTVIGAFLGAASDPAGSLFPYPRTYRLLLA